MGHMIGIDLGTTNTAVCAMVGGRPKMIKNKKGYTVFPSAVFEDSSGKIIVGRQAKTAMMTEPERGVFAVKRLLGRRFDSDEVAQIKKQVPYAIKAAPDGSCLVQMAGTWYSPVDIAAFILKEAKNIAEVELGDSVDQAVITVPAYYNHGQREATKQAASKAGLQCDRIINEPTAAALAYGERKTGERTVLIFDLGGGTFDVSILQFSEGLVETLSTKGDTFLGGEDFDERLLDLLADQFFNAHNRDPREDAIARRRLKDAAESAKCELSFRDQTNILVPRLIGTTNLEAPLSRGELEQIVDDLVQRAIQVTSDAVSDAGLRLQDVDDLVLVGGQTRMPLIRQRVSTLLHREPVYGVNPEEVVATGACVHGFSLVSERSNAPILMDVTPFDLGVDIRGGFFERIIARNSHVPTMETKSFSTGRLGQDAVRIVVRQGESRYASENEFLGEFVMSNLMPNDQGIASVDVTLRLDANGMLHVSATDPATGERHHITARNYAQFVSDKDSGLDITSEHQKGTKPQGSPATADTIMPIDDGGSEPETQKSGFFSRLFGRKKEPAPVVDMRAEREPQNEEAESLTDALETINFDELLPVGTEQSEGSAIQTDESLFDLLAADQLSDDLQDLDISDLSEIEPLENDDVQTEKVSKVATLGMGDSSAAAEQSISTEKRSDVQFDGQDDTLLIDVFNEDSTIDSLLFDGLEAPDESATVIPEPILQDESESDIHDLLSSILDEPADSNEADTQIMDRSQLLEAVGATTVDVPDIRNEEQELAMLLDELEQDVTAPVPLPQNESLPEQLPSDDDLADVLEEFDIEFDFDAPEAEPDVVQETVISVEEGEDELDIDAMFAEHGELPVEPTPRIDDDALPDIDTLLAEFEIDLDNIEGSPEPVVEQEAEPSTESGGLEAVDDILAGEDDIDIDSFLASLDIPEIDASDAADNEIEEPEPPDEAVELPISFDAEDDDVATHLFVREKPGSHESSNTIPEPTHPSETDNTAESAASDTHNDEAPVTSHEPDPQDVLASAIAIQGDNVFDAIPDDGFFELYDAKPHSKEAASTEQGIQLDMDLDDIEDQPLDIPDGGGEQDLDFLDDLFDD